MTSLSSEERSELFRVAVETGAGRKPIVAGAGTASLDETKRLVESAEQAGVDALLIVTPYYIKPNEAGLIEYFRSVAGATELPVLIYHIPGRSGVTVQPDTITEICECAPNVVGIKHAAVDLDLVSELLARMPDFRVFCGLESLSLPMLAIGAAGLMNAVGNLIPGCVAELCEAVFGEKLALARQIHYELFGLNRAIFLDTNPVPLKYMMARLGLLPSAELRLPLAELQEAQQRELDRVLEAAGLLESVAARGSR